MSVGQTIPSQGTNRQGTRKKVEDLSSVTVAPLRLLTLDEAKQLIVKTFRTFKTQKSGEFVTIAGYISREDFLELLNEDVKLERIGGMLIIHSPASYSHESQFAFLITLLRIYALAKNLGFAMGSRLAFDVVNQNKPDDPDTVEPDISLITPEDAKIFEKLTGPLPKLPEFIIEILSPGTRDYDLTTKKQLYFNNGVKECWFVDEQEALVQVCRKTKSSYRCRRVEEGIIRSKQVPGFWVDVSWLWKDYNIEVLQNALGRLLNDPNDWKTLLSRLDKEKLGDVFDLEIAVVLFQQFGEAILPLLLDHFGEAVLPTVLDYFGEAVLPTVLDYFGEAVLPTVLDHFGEAVLPTVLDHFGEAVLPTVLDHFGEAVLPTVLDYFGEAVLPTVLDYFGEKVVPLVLEKYGDTALKHLLEHYGPDLLPKIIAFYGKETISQYLVETEKEDHEQENGNKDN